MHPIDVLCGSYSYQCITNPFELRMDDVDTLALLYPVGSWNVGGAKTLSSGNALNLGGMLNFPTGQGMDWVNIVATRQLQSTGKTEQWQVASNMTGYEFQQNVGNPVTGPEGQSENVGLQWGPGEGLFSIPRVDDSVVENVYLTTEAIDPLYTGEYAIGPYERPPVTPSGSPFTMTDWSGRAGTGFYDIASVPDAAARCSPGADGTQGTPAASDASGWWKGQLCGVGHSSWWKAAVKAGSSWTIEVTATDESGAATMSKAQPVIGVWNTGDGGLPTVASQPAAMNSLAPGVTQLEMPAGAGSGSYMFVVADQYGGGRPDFTYTARVLYAAGVSPAMVSSTGGQIVIAGEGFRQGNQVSVNGVAATVVSWSSNQIVARAPSMAAAGVALGVPVDVMVTDAATGGQTDIANGFMYSNVQPDKLVLSQPTLETGVAAALTAQLTEPDGATPIANATVQLSVVSGTAGFAACGGATTCVLTTTASGAISTTLTGGAAGAVVLTAIEVNGSAAVQVTLQDVNPVRAATMANNAGYVAAGASATWTVVLNATQDGAAVAGAPVVWTAGSGISLSGGTGVTDAAGAAEVTVSVSKMSAGSATVIGCVWGSACATWTVTAVDASQWTITVANGAGQSVNVGTALAPVLLGVTDTAGHPLVGATVSVYQTTDGWEGACPAQGRCASAPVLASNQSTAVSDGNGDVTVVPLVVAGEPQVVNIAAVTGTQGFCSLSLPVMP
jgi:hypothetical protein